MAGHESPLLEEWTCISLNAAEAAEFAAQAEAGCKWAQAEIGNLPADLEAALEELRAEDCAGRDAPTMMALGSVNSADVSTVSLSTV